MKITATKRAVLGLDAAWKSKQPTGAALAVEHSSGWDLVAVVSSYQRFHASADCTLIPELRPSGALPVASALLASLRCARGRAYGSRRDGHAAVARADCRSGASDNAVSRAHGGRKVDTYAQGPACDGSTPLGTIGVGSRRIFKWRTHGTKPQRTPAASQALPARGPCTCSASGGIFAWPRAKARSRY
jgi:hypothetical protein